MLTDSGGLKSKQCRVKPEGPVVINQHTAGDGRIDEGLE